MTARKQQELSNHCLLWVECCSGFGPVAALQECPLPEVRLTYLNSAVQAIGIAVTGFKVRLSPIQGYFQVSLRYCLALEIHPNRGFASFHRIVRIRMVAPYQSIGYMKRRDLVTLALSAGLGISPTREAFAMEDIWGANDGYPIGWGSPSRFTGNLRYRVGNFSGGFAALMPHNTIHATAPAPLPSRSDISIRYNFGFSRKGPADYLAAWPVTGLLIARKGAILYEGYGMGRDTGMTLTSMSMAKSVTSLLVGICVDQGLILSLDDAAEKYAPALKDSLHGQTTLRNLMNMSSGAAIEHDRDNNYIYPHALRNANSSVVQTVKQWNARKEPQGTRFNYNELCALTVGLVVSAVTGGSLSEFAQKYLWTPLGAEGDATWLMDSQQTEFNCIGFNAKLRDWAKLGLLMAQRGKWNDQQVISRGWMDGYSKWTSAEAQVRPGMLEGKGANRGYNRFIWHEKADGSRPAFHGAYGQHIFVDLPTETVLLQTSVADDTEPQKSELWSLFQAAIAAS